MTNQSTQHKTSQSIGDTSRFMGMPVRHDAIDGGTVLARCRGVFLKKGDAPQYDFGEIEISGADGKAMPVGKQMFVVVTPNDAGKRPCAELHGADNVLDMNMVRLVHDACGDWLAQCVQAGCAARDDAANI